MSHSTFFLLVCGSRTYSNTTVLHQHLDRALQRQPGLVVVTGCGRGADRMAIDWAVDRGVPYARYAAQWSRFGKAAGPRRNQRMLSIAHGVLAFPLAGSKGTVGVISSAHKQGIPTRVVAP